MKPRTLADFTGLCKPSGEELCYQHCPVCAADNWKTYVNTQTGFWYCFSPRHSNPGGRVECGALGCTAHNYAPVWTEIELPASRRLTANAWNYLFTRFPTYSCIELARFDMRSNKSDTGIITPYYNATGQIIYWTQRFIPRLYPTRRKHLAANGPKPPWIYPDWADVRVEPTVLVEGIFDAMSVHLATKLPVMSIGGTTISNTMYETIKTLNPKKLIVLLDNDALSKSISVCYKLQSLCTIAIQFLPLNEDPNSVEPSVLKEILYEYY